MFPESSTWRAEVVRVDGRRATGAGRRAVGGLPVGRPRRRPWAVDAPRCATTPTPGSTTSSPSSTRRSTGSPTTPRATPRRSTSRPPSRLAQHRPTRGRRPAQRRAGRRAVSCAGGRRPLRRAARPPGQHARAGAAAGAGRPDRRCSTSGRSSPPRRTGRIYRDTFYEPYAAWYPGAAARRVRRRAVVGARGRGRDDGRSAHPGRDATTFAVVTYNLFLSTTHVHNNRAYLVIVLGRARGGAVRAGALGRRLAAGPRGLPALPTTAPAWPLLLLRFEASVVYGASGLSKLVDPDWFGGTVTWHRVVRAATGWRRARCPTGSIAVLPTGRSTPSRRR